MREGREREREREKGRRQDRRQDGRKHENRDRKVILMSRGRCGAQHSTAQHIKAKQKYNNTPHSEAQQQQAGAAAVYSTDWSNHKLLRSNHKSGSHLCGRLELRSRSPRSTGGLARSRSLSLSTNPLVWVWWILICYETHHYYFYHHNHHPHSFCTTTTHIYIHIYIYACMTHAYDGRA